MKPSKHFLTAALAVLCAASVAMADFYVIPVVKKEANTIRVATSGGDFSDPVAALNSITDSGPDNPYLVTIGPGTYDIGAQQLILKPYVRVVGSGVSNVDNTVITGTYDSVDLGDYNFTAMVQSANYSTLEEMVIRHTTSTTNTYMFKCQDVNTTLRNVYFDKTDGVTAHIFYAMELDHCNAQIRDVTIQLSGDIYAAVGIYAKNDSVVQLQNPQITAISSATNGTTAVDTSNIGLRIFATEMSLVGGTITVFDADENSGIVTGRDAHIALSGTQIDAGTTADGHYNYGFKLAGNDRVYANGITVNAMGINGSGVSAGTNSFTTLIESTIEATTALAGMDADIMALYSTLEGNNQEAICSRCKNIAGTLLDSDCLEP